MDRLKIKYSIAILIAIAVVLSMAPSVAATEYSYSVDWTGHGSDSQRCGTPNEDDPRYEFIESGWIHWVFANKGASINAKLVVNGDEYYPGEPLSANVWHFYTPYYDLNDTMATIYLDGEPAKPAKLVISDYCPGDGGDGGILEALVVLKTVETSYNRTHNWSIDKYVETDYGYELGGFSKIWLFANGSGNENATWTVDVTYEGYNDSDYMIWGEITIINGGNVPANITSVVDELAGTPIDIDCNVTFPYILPVDGILVCNYSVNVDSKLEGFNNVTVTTYNATREVQNLTYDSLPEPIVWGDPDNESFKTVNITDLSDLFGEVDLGNVTAPYGDTFTYNKSFAWADYYEADECGSFMYNNTATIVETGESADATLKVNVQCLVFDGETAWAANGDVPLVFRYTKQGNWATYVEYKNVAKTTTLFAGKTIPVGYVDFSAPVDGKINIKVTMNPGWEFEDVAENLKVQDYAKAPSGNPSPGLFAHKKTCDPELNECTITVPQNKFYGVHVNVGQWIPDPNFGPE